jgi:hypothetical protein
LVDEIVLRGFEEEDASGGDCDDGGGDGSIAMTPLSLRGMTGTAPVGCPRSPSLRLPCQPFSLFLRGYRQVCCCTVDPRLPRLALRGEDAERGGRVELGGCSSFGHGQRLVRTIQTFSVHLVRECRTSLRQIVKSW